MKFSRYSRGIAALAAAFALFALFFDAIPAAIASGALVAVLAARAALFLSALSSAAGSLGVHRTLSSRLVRQGRSVTVGIKGRIAVPRGCSAILSDLPPHGMIPSPGSATTEVAGGESAFHLNYSLSPFLVGEHAFGGIAICLSDLFFSADLVCRTGDATAPSLVILPSAEYPLSGQATAGEKESASVGLLRSPDIRSFRKYLPGDDPKAIDWKLSAKFDTLYVREYMGRADYATLLVIDLPDASLPFSSDAFKRLKEAAVSAIVFSMAERGPSSVLLISGPNLVSFSLLDQDPGRLVAMMHQLAPLPRLHHLYRYRSTGTLRRRFAPLTGSADPFLRSLCRISAGFLAHRPSTTFESQMGRVFHVTPGSSAHLFTLGARDTSHIRIISEQAALNGVRLQVHIPDGAADPARLSRSLAVPVEVA
jgi:uncharacterized protein (DUF58 family)